MTELVPAESCRIVTRRNPFTTDRIERTVKAGGTLAELLAEAIPDRALHRHAHITLSDAALAQKGEVIPPALWHRVRPKPGTALTITLVPMGGGGKNPFRIILSLAVIAASFAFGSALGALGLEALGIKESAILFGSLTAGKVAGAIGGFIIPCAGPLLIASVPPRKEISP